MPADLAAIHQHLATCYDLAGRTVIHVGDGRSAGGAGRSRVAPGDLLTVTARADVVLLEFCLHRIVDPLSALRHARALAPDVLVLDHAPGSSWAWHLGEAEKVLRGWAAAARFDAALDRTFAGVRRFRDHAELLAAVRGRGEPALRRIEEFRGRRDFAIDAPCRVVLLSRPGRVGPSRAGARGAGPAIV